MVPSTGVENEISCARLLPAIGQLSLPRVMTRSAAMRSAAAVAASATSVGTAGANGATGTAIAIVSGVPSAASCGSSAVRIAALSTARPSFDGVKPNVPPSPADTVASTGVSSIVVARASIAAASLSRS